MGGGEREREVIGGGWQTEKRIKRGREDKGERGGGRKVDRRGRRQRRGV